MFPGEAAVTRRRRTQAERTAATRERLLEATVATLVERGWHRASTAAICRRARVTRGAQLHHWPTKAGLVAAAIEHVFRRRHEELRQALLGAGAGGPAAIQAAFRKLWEIYSGPTLVAWLELVVAARTDRRLRAAIQGVDARFMAEAEATLCGLFGARRGRRTAAAARLVTSLLDGLALHRQVQGEAAAAGPVLALFQELLAPWGRGGLSPRTGTAARKKGHRR